VELDAEACFRALATRDRRFDGRFFTAVRSTGVYCRPICPAPTPRRENCVFVACAAAAEAQGFRPCRRCRPEASPGTPAWIGTSATVSRALRLIGDGALDRGSVGELAGRLGIGERHLRRLFVEHLGAAPLAVAATRRALFARRLLDETSLPVAQVAFASGFSSVRRFNEAMRAVFRATPTGLRRRGARAGPASELELRLPYRPPLPWAALLGFLASRAIPGVEEVVAGAYRRSFSIEGVEGAVEVRAVAGRDHLLARIRLAAPAPLIRIAERLRALFDLGADPGAIEAQLSGDRLLAPRLASLPGVRVPGAFDGFELAVRAILGQQVSVAAATRLAGRVAATHGAKLRIATWPGSTLRLLFPAPRALGALDPRSAGLPAARAGAIASLARAVESGEIALDGSRDLETSVRELAALPGIGEWTAQVVAMRALREPDALPAGDLGLRRALGARGALASAAEVRSRAEAWRPWRAYGAALLWMVDRGRGRTSIGDVGERPPFGGRVVNGDAGERSPTSPHSPSAQVAPQESVARAEPSSGTAQRSRTTEPEPASSTRAASRP
jgi:AraC family transcriptional regulator of adaptative response / DNA-3-methyladenine glycosylase II